MNDRTSRRRRKRAGADGHADASDPPDAPAPPQAAAAEAAAEPAGAPDAARQAPESGAEPDAGVSETAAVARANGARVGFEPCNQIAASRNAAGRAAKGDWLVFVDADTQVTP